MMSRQTDTPVARGPIAAALIGVWRWKHYRDVAMGAPAQHPFGLNPQGLLIYAADGFVSAMLMAPGRPNMSGDGFSGGTAAEYEAAGRGFIGYSGIFDVDEALSVVTHRPVVAFAPNMVGNFQRRLVKLNGNVLVLTADHVDPPNSETARSILEWVRVKAALAVEE